MTVRASRPGCDPRVAQASPLVRAEGLTVEYEKTREKTRLVALSEVSLDIGSGEFVVIVGPSAGESRTLRGAASHG